MTPEERFTHLVSLWLNNDYGMYSAIKDAFECGSISNGRELRDCVTDDIMGDAFCDPGMTGDLLQYAVQLVDWDELYSDFAEGLGLNNMKDEEAAQ